MAIHLKLGSSIGTIEYGSVGTLHRPIPVAVPLHGNRMDVSRRLRSRGLLDRAERAGESSLNGSANCVAVARFSSSQLGEIPIAGMQACSIGQITADLGFLYFGLEFALQRSRGTARQGAQGVSLCFMWTYDQ